VLCEAQSRHGGCVFHSVNIYISINNPARRPQFRKGRLAAKTGRGESCPSKWTEGRGEGVLLCGRRDCVW